MFSGKNTSSNIEMTFVCDQKWSKLKSTANGKYCGVCSQEVFDFTNKSLLEISELKSANNNLCGYFNASETNEKPIEFNFLSKSFAVASTLFLLSTAEVKAQNVDTTHVVHQHPDKKKTNGNPAEAKDEVVPKAEKPVDASYEKPYKSVKRIRLFRIGDYSYGLINRFPFFYARRAVMGRFRL